MGKEIKISNTPTAVQFMYDDYRQGKYLVNRKYQRKLVWSISEKEAFIDSLMRQYSVPLFLFAADVDSGSEHVEIIDGMQRMNAVIGFIENEFPIDYNGLKGFFDLDTLASTKALKDSGSLAQQKPILGRDECTRFVSYPLPMSYLSADSKSIETVFRRINSFGRQLSEQEIRMAGAVGAFPSLVRHISSEIRGDVSRDDLMALRDMAKISISSKKLNYGLSLSNIFWVKNKIITSKNIRTSRDEELISQILAYILLGNKTEPTKKTIDGLYQYESKETRYEIITAAIEKRGIGTIKESIITVHNVLKKVADDDGRPLMDIIYKDKVPDSIFRSYQVLFLAIYELMIVNGYRKIDYNSLRQMLEGIGTREFDNIGRKDWCADFRNSKIAAVKGLFASAFSKYADGDVAKEDYTTQLDNLLTLSRSEGTHFDFKQTCHELKGGQFSPELVEKIVKTLVAMINNPISCGYVILGIADKKESADKFKNFYNSEYKILSNSNFFVTGVDSEIDKYYGGNVDNYVKRIKGVIDNTDVDNRVKSAIKRGIKEFTYYGHTIIIFRLDPQNEPMTYNNKFYIREHNDCKELTGSSILELAANFKKIISKDT